MLDEKFSDSKQKLEQLVKMPGVLAAFLVGSAVTSENNNFTGDIDIFLIMDNEEDLEREVVEREERVWDITFLPLNLLKQGIKEKWPFLITSLGKSKPIVVRDNRINPLMEEIYKLNEEGPGALSEEEINYLRFKLSQDFDALIARRDDCLNARFLGHSLFKEVITTYFRVNNQWVPKEKKMLSSIKSKDQELYNMCIDFLEENNIQESLGILENMLNYVLNPFGGQLKFWAKGKFPVD